MQILTTERVQLQTWCVLQTFKLRLLKHKIYVLKDLYKL